MTPRFTLFISTSGSLTIAATGGASVIDGMNLAPPSPTMALSTLAVEPGTFSAGQGDHSHFWLGTANLTENPLPSSLGAARGMNGLLDPHETFTSATRPPLWVVSSAGDGGAMASDPTVTATALPDGDSSSCFVTREQLLETEFPGGASFHLAGLDGFTNAPANTPGDQVRPRTVVITVTPPLRTSVSPGPSSSSKSE
jgi:hypothetical protein